MAHVLYVDLSAKIEHWTRDSAIAVSNGHSRVYLVTGKTKRKARSLIKSLYGAKVDRYRLLAVLVYLVVRADLEELTYIVIDQDYGGAQIEGTIKNFLLPLLRLDNPSAMANMIRFAEVKGSRADKLAKQTYDGKIVPDRIVKYAELEALLRGQKESRGSL